MAGIEEGPHIQTDLNKLLLEDLRKKWQEVWAIEPHRRIGRAMMVKSIEYKMREQRGSLKPEQAKRLKQLVSNYKRNPRCFDENIVGIKPGTRLIKIWKENRYSVLVLENGFEYQEKVYTSLSEIAFAITGTRWNGWVFFGLKKKEKLDATTNS